MSDYRVADLLARKPALESEVPSFYDEGMAREIPILTSDRLILRKPHAEDIEARLRLGTHREIVEAYGATFDPAAAFTRNHAESLIAFIESQEYAWVIDVKGFIGHIRFFGLNQRDQRASLAIGIEDPAHLGKGYGSEAIRLALNYIFSIGFHRISVRVLASNDRAIACYRKCGFMIEGREREAAFVDGQWQDDILMGVLDRELILTS
ncbi:GNAT family N-acetyltransferase [Bradyrhizobium sp. AZCC 1719]|uniref:GNAT family N-acetyltransferase n=1 Tax=Bradyrhizobium sp. AZCC 1719 TaxID=3117028 RepID=UPI002FF36CB5